MSEINFIVDGIKYMEIDETLHNVTIIGYEEGFNRTSVLLPSTVTYNGTIYNVTSIEWNAFEDCTSIL